MAAKSNLCEGELTRGSFSFIPYTNYESCANKLKLYIFLSTSVNMAGVSEYKINGRVMLYADYDKALQRINILVKARNFLVFQVTV